MSEVKTILNRRLTGREAAAVIAIVAVLAAAGYLGWQTISARILEAKVNAALPIILSQLRDQRQTIVAAIENYKKEFGFYPPDHVASRQPLLVNAYTNPLLYELAGTLVDTNGFVQFPRQEAAEMSFVKEFFHSTGIVNSGTSAAAVKRFLSPDTCPVRQLHDDPDVFALGFQIYTAGIPGETIWEFDLSPWQYVSSAPVHNPGKFDLWLEVKTKTRSVTVGNWKEVE
jgi:hypothetical protein